MKEIETLIIGAGPAGLAAATELSKSQKDFIVVEKQSRVGGLAKTYEFKERNLRFRTDNGPHRFFSKNEHLYSFFADLLQEQWIEVKRQTRQYIDGKFYEYPVNPAQALTNIGFKKAFQMGLQYAAAQIQYGLLKKEIKNFEDYIIAHFGRGLGEFNMINYTEKIWGVPASTIHTDWARQRIKGLSVGFLTKAAFHKAFSAITTEKLRTLADVFYYPEHGTGTLYEKIKDQLEGGGRPLWLNSYPIAIRHAGKKITDVIIQKEDVHVEMQVSHCIESIPPKEFLRLLDPAPPIEISAAAQKMNYRDQVYLFITLDKERVSYDQWIYFPEKHIPFGRISEMKNFSQKMSPSGKTSLFVEFFCFENDSIWNASKEELLELTMSYLEPLGFCKKSEIRNYYHLKQKKAYPIYDTSYKEYLTTVQKYLDQFENLYYIGRPGRFRYNNQDHSLEMGFAAAKSIIEGKRYDLDEIGAGTEYLEKGYWQKS